ncbi:MAG TPA: glycosyltransferase [Intrasporangium sp.]|uniref:glycosyltransferase n=1 Tax=Intrasporangium sp. TaxID=1925024 RepID=UPI002D7921FE|nr:glycosyltransferase [Intrasporangium sp.]HET7398571.1 glycosyltransferase [Intrasporangium sp.]
MRPPVVRLATRLFAPEVGAAAFRERLLADAFAAAGWRVEVVTTLPPAGAPTPDDGPLRVSRWPVLRDEGGNIRGYVQYLSYDLPLLARLLLARRADLYVAEPPPTTGVVVRLAAALRRRPYIWYAADVWSDAAAISGAPAPVLWALRAVERWVLRGAALVLSVSDGVTDRCVELGVSRDRAVTVGNGVDTAVFRPDGDAEPAATPYFVYTGTMSEWQDASVFVRALRRHHDAGGTERLVFLGQGSDLPALRTLAEQLVPGLVDFPGVVPPADAARWLRGATAALVSIKPGQGYDFAKPTKIYAATGCGTPVVFAGRGAGAELVGTAGLGWAVEHDEAAVAAAMAEAVAAAGADEPERVARRERLAAWTVEHASSAALARRAADECIARLGRA